MLQIATGKLFIHEPEYRNELRGVVHTNLQLHSSLPIETKAGRLLPTSFLRDTGIAVYELTELIEGRPDSGPGVLVSHGIDPYLSDFAIIVSFALNVTCTTDGQLTRRLTSSQPGALVGVAPKSLIRRAFDRQVWCQEEDARKLIEFIDALMGLKRKTYLACMRAIRSYVTGLHRLLDDPGLTYTLLVASIESLAQRFDGHSPEWEDYPQEKRLKLEEALKEADDLTRRRVKRALLEIEHVAISRRFREFTLRHIQPSYFREEASELVNPIGHADLLSALKRAYDLRSSHIHRLKELPTLLTDFPHYGESLRTDKDTILTFQGLARLARHVISEFIKRQPTVKTEAYDYSRELAGIIQVPLAPQYWIGSAPSLTASSGQKRLEGFLGQLTTLLQEGQEPAITDLREVLVKTERLLPTVSKRQRRPFVVLYILFNKLVLHNVPLPNYEAVMERYISDTADPCIESMVLHLLLGTIPEWTLEEHQRVHDDYLRSQGKRNCLQVPIELRAGLSLALAERYQALGDAERARALISVAVENHPGNSFLYRLEQSFEPERPIIWQLEDLSSHPGSQPNH